MARKCWQVNTSDIVIMGTAWLTGLGYAGGLLFRLKDRGWSSRAAGAWLCGAVLMAVHIIAAFHLRHDWSHHAAVIDTARQTRELTGWEWGGGVWLNYLLMVLWLADALWLKWNKASYDQRAPLISVVIQGYLAFMWFNATVVFGSAGARIFGVVTVIAMVWARMKRSV